MYPHSPDWFHPPMIMHFIGGILRILLIFGGAFFLLWYYLKQSRKGVHNAPGNEGLKVILPLRLQACERFVLFLERIHPSNLVMRLHNPDLTALQLQSLLTRTIREEFEYNLSQQLYISQHSWELIKNAKEETIAMVNQASAKVGEQALSSELVKEIFDISISKGKLPLDIALEDIKREIQLVYK